MEYNFKLKKGFLSTTYNICANDHTVGKLTENPCSQTADGEINGKKYTFKTEGFLNPKTKIIDNETNKSIGEITYNKWMMRGEILIHGVKNRWKYDNNWNTQWGIYESMIERLSMTAVLQKVKYLQL